MGLKRSIPIFVILWITFVTYEFYYYPTTATSMEFGMGCLLTMASSLGAAILGGKECDV